MATIIFCLTFIHMVFWQKKHEMRLDMPHVIFILAFIIVPFIFVVMNCLAFTKIILIV